MSLLLPRRAIGRHGMALQVATTGSAITPGATRTKVPGTTATQYDGGGVTSGTAWRLVAPSTGRYMVRANIPYTVNQDQAVDFAFAINGDVEADTIKSLSPGASKPAVAPLTAVLDLTAGDYVEPFVSVPGSGTAEFAMRLGLGLGLSMNQWGGGGEAIPDVAITSPAADTQFIVGVPQSVGITSDQDGTYAVTFDGTNERGTIVVSGGSGSGNITAAWADGIAGTALTSFTVRRQGVSESLAMRACAIFTGPEAAIQDGTVVLAYDAERNATTGGGAITALSPVVGGGAADVLAPIVNAPPYGTIASLGGRNGITGGSNHAMRSTTPASAVEVAQPDSVICVGVPPSYTGTNKFWWSSANSGARQDCYRFNTINRYSFYAGTAAVQPASPVPTDSGLMIELKANGASSSAVETVLSSGVETDTGTMSLGTNAIKGLTIHAAFDNSIRSDDSVVSAWMVVTGITADDRTRLKTWANLTAARGGCGAFIPL